MDLPEWKSALVRKSLLCLLRLFAEDTEIFRHTNTSIRGRSPGYHTLGSTLTNALFSLSILSHQGLEGRRRLRPLQQ